MKEEVKTRKEEAKWILKRSFMHSFILYLKLLLFLFSFRTFSLSHTQIHSFAKQNEEALFYILYYMHRHTHKKTREREREREKEKESE